MLVSVIRCSPLTIQPYAPDFIRAYAPIRSTETDRSLMQCDSHSQRRLSKAGIAQSDFVAILGYAAPPADLGALVAVAETWLKSVEYLRFGHTSFCPNSIFGRRRRGCATHPLDAVVCTRKQTQPPQHQGGGIPQNKESSNM